MATNFDVVTETSSELNGRVQFQQWCSIDREIFAITLNWIPIRLFAPIGERYRATLLHSNYITRNIKRQLLGWKLSPVAF